MKKPRADAKWNGLTIKQQGLLEQWLFEERLSYEAAHQRARQELDYPGSVSSLRRFYEHTAEERTLKSLATSLAQARGINESTVSTEELQAAGMKIVAQLFLNRAVQSPEQPKEWPGLGRLLLQGEANKIKFRLKQEENELRRQELGLARERFQYDAMEQGQKALPELKALEEANLSKYEKNKRQNALRRRLFGPNIPEPKPENEAEEIQMAEQELKDEAERAKQHEWWLKRFGHLQGGWRNYREQSLAAAAASPEPEEGEATAGNSEETSGTKGADIEEAAKVMGEVVERGVVYPYGQ